MSEIQQLKTETELKEMIERFHDDRFFIFKHSTTCPISAKAYEEVKKFKQMEAHGDVVVGMINVIEDRPVSDAVTERFGIKHESPQVLFVEDGTNVVWHASHWKITKENLEKAKQT